MPANEIEMFIIQKKILDSTIDIEVKSKDDKINNFVNKFIKLNIETIEKQTVEYCRYYFSRNLLFSNDCTLKGLEGEILNKIDTLNDYKTIYDSRYKKLLEVYNSDDYDEMLKYSNIKNSIKQPLDKLDNNYVERAKIKIRDKVLSKVLRNKIGIPYIEEI